MSKCVVCAALVVAFLVSSVSLAAAQVRVTVIQTSPVYVLPDATRQPLAQLDPSVSLVVVESRGPWLTVAWEDERFGHRTGYVQTKYTTFAAQVAAQRVAAPQVPPPASTPAASTTERAAPPAADLAAKTTTRGDTAARTSSLKDVRRLYIEKMPNDLDQYIAAEISKQMTGRVVIVLDRAAADAVMRGVSSEQTGVGAAVTGRYLGLHDNASGSITLVDSAETVVLWASEAGDRSLIWGSLARGGQRKVAARLVSDLKKALTSTR